MASNSNNMNGNNNNKVPPGFRFHPTDEELVDYYLKKKVESQRIDLDVIREIDLYKIEPWDLQERCRIGSTDQDEWYFFSHKDKKYPTGTRTNRATTAGFWKATGRDKAIYSRHKLVGMRKTLVFYRGRAPNGQKTDWIMHEYRLENCESNCNPLQTSEEGWAVCRVFKKRSPNVKLLFPEHNMASMGATSNMGGCSFEDQMATFLSSANTHQYMMGMDRGVLMDDGIVYGHPWSNTNMSTTINNDHQERLTMQNGNDDDEDDLDDDHGLHQVSFACKQELDQLTTDYHISHDTSLMQLPQLLESPPLKLGTNSCFPISGAQYSHDHMCHNHIQQEQYNQNQNQTHASTLSHLRALIGSPNINQNLNSSTAHDFPVRPKVPILANMVLGTHMQQASPEVTDWRVLDRLVASQLSQDHELTTTDSPIPTMNSMLKASSSMSDLHDPQNNNNEDNDTSMNAIPTRTTTTTTTATTTTIATHNNKNEDNDLIRDITPNYNPNNDVDLWSFSKRSELG